MFEEISGNDNIRIIITLTVGNHSAAAKRLTMGLGRAI